LLPVALRAGPTFEARPDVLPGILGRGAPLRRWTWRGWLHPGIVTAMGPAAPDQRRMSDALCARQDDASTGAVSRPDRIAAVRGQRP
jgi:hypothetical protein